MSWQAQGFRAWLFQRITAVYIGVYIIVLAVKSIAMEGISYLQWQQIISEPLMNVSLLLFFYAIFLHSWVGIRNVIIDYAGNVTIKILMLTFVAIALLVMMIWVSLVLMSVIQL